MASNKGMNEWNDSEVKNWIKSLQSLNDKQKELICNGVDSIGCDGDSLACAESAEELKDALEIPIILARKLHKAVQQFCNAGSGGGNNNQNGGNNNQNGGGQPQQQAPQQNNNNNNNNPPQQNQGGNQGGNTGATNTQSNAGGSGEQESEEAVLARLIARNLAAKKTQPQAQNSAPMGMGGGMGMPMGGNQGGGMNMNMGGMQQQPQQQQKSLFTWGANNNNNNNNGNGGMMGASADFKINIQGSNGKLISLNSKCNKHTKIKNVKQLLASQEGGDPAKMVMKYNGRTMDDSQNLGFYGIADSRNLITVTFKVVGGKIN